MERGRLEKASGILSEDDVRKINRIIETLNQSTFDYLQVEIGEFKLTIAKGQAPAVELMRATAEIDATVTGGTGQRLDGPPAAGLSSAAAKDDGTIAIAAPLVGRFYSQPEPGAAPFVVAGSEVGEDTTVGLIEVMKTFNAVRAGVTGIVTEICVQDAALVEYGQALFRVRPKS
jgi:acetyl-CoA carboxylase biotin carboxyl carrier protein